MFVAGELLVKLLLGDAAAVFFLGAEIFGNGECRHYGRVVDVVFFYFIGNLEGVRYSLGQVGEEMLHFGTCFQPFLFGVEHAVVVRQVVVGGQADKTVVSLGVLLVDEVGVVGGYYLYVVFARESYDFWLDGAL